MFKLKVEPEIRVPEPKPAPAAPSAPVAPVPRPVVPAPPAGKDYTEPIKGIRKVHLCYSHMLCE